MFPGVILLTVFTTLPPLYIQASFMKVLITNSYFFLIFYYAQIPVNSASPRIIILANTCPTLLLRGERMTSGWSTFTYQDLATPSLLNSILPHGVYQAHSITFNVL